MPDETRRDQGDTAAHLFGTPLKLHCATGQHIKQATLSVRVAAGDVNGDGRADSITGGGAPR